MSLVSSIRPSRMSSLPPPPLSSSALIVRPYLSLPQYSWILQYIIDVTKMINASIPAKTPKGNFPHFFLLANSSFLPPTLFFLLIHFVTPVVTQLPRHRAFSGIAMVRHKECPFAILPTFAPLHSTYPSFRSFPAPFLFHPLLLAPVAPSI